MSYGQAGKYALKKYVFYGKILHVNIDFHTFVAHYGTVIMYVIIFCGARLLVQGTEKLGSKLDIPLLLMLVFFVVERLSFWIVALSCAVVALLYASHTLFFERE
jgi:hypothetical protein